MGKGVYAQSAIAALRAYPQKQHNGGTVLTFFFFIFFTIIGANKLLLFNTRADVVSYRTHNTIWTARRILFEMRGAYNTFLKMAQTRFEIEIYDVLVI